MASKAFLTRKKIEEIGNGNGAGDEDLASIGFGPPNSDAKLSPMPFGSMSSSSSALRGTPRLPTITMPTAVALAQKQLLTTQQSAGGGIRFTPPFAHPGAPSNAATQLSSGGGGMKFTPPFAHPWAPSNNHSSTGGLNWRHWGQLYADQDRSPLPPVRSSDMGTRDAAQPMSHRRPHPTFSTSSKDSLSSNGLNLLADTLACLEGPTPPPPVSGPFLGGGGTIQAGLLYRDGEGALKGLTPIPVLPTFKPSAKPKAVTTSASTFVSAAVPPKLDSGKVNHPGALDIYQDIPLAPSAGIGRPAKGHNPGALLPIGNGGPNVPISKGKKKGRKAADAFTEVDSSKGGGSGGTTSTSSGRGDGNNKKRKKTLRWTKEEDDILRQAVEADTNPKTDWKSIAATHFPGVRDASHCRTRWSKHIDPAVSKEPFSADEDRVILQKLAEGKSFANIAKELPGRVTEQVRRRWESIQPKKKGAWTEAEVKILIEKYHEYGSNWSMIAKFIEGRTATQIKNRWHNYQVNQEKVVQERKSEE